MKKLLSLPANLVGCFKDIEGVEEADYFCASDPAGGRVGSGGGTAWLMNQCWKAETERTQRAAGLSFADWLRGEKRIVVHAGGQSRRVPAYAPSGKVLIPIPVFRWKRGQRINQNLLDLELDLYEEILSKGNARQNTLIASGDVLVRANEPIAELPQADVVCFGLWTSKELASSHGVFVCPKERPQELAYMLQKPSVAQLNEELKTHLFLLDLGVWVLSDRAIEVLMAECGCAGQADKVPDFYDLYGTFGLGLGATPLLEKAALKGLSVAVVPLQKGVFNHFGTSPELISSMLSIQNEVIDQRAILHQGTKVHPSLFTQNMVFEGAFRPENRNLWIENSYLDKGWVLRTDHVITGVPRNDWSLDLPAGVCVDMVPMGERAFALRLYHFRDRFRGAWQAPETSYLGVRLTDWLAERDLDGEVLWGTKSLYRGVNDIQALPLFPVLEDLDRVPALVAWLLGVGSSVVQAAGRSYWLKGRRVSADDLMAKANLPRLFAQRKVFMQENLKGLKANGSKSVFYQLDLEHVAKLWVASGHALEPKAFVADALDFKEMQEWMFRSRVKELQGLLYKEEELMAFRLLRNRFLKLAVQDKVCPKRSVFPDQIVWGRSPIRVELAGGWTDTPPYSVVNGGKVVNVSFRLNGQDPLQVYVRRTDALTITLRSIDLGTSEVIRDWERLALYDRIGNEFSITKAALSICGFSPDFCRVRYVSLEKQLAAFGGGLEVSTFAAIPKGSGLGTSSILSATILSAVADFCGLGWSRKTVCEKALVLEQMLTSGGGWQDQYGGAMAGVKLLESEPGIGQEIYVKWGPERLFKAPESKDRMLLYYTGITRVAKHILGNIVKSMFLNEKKNLAVLEAMKGHAEHTFGAIQRGDLEALAADVNRSWEMYKQLDAGTNPPAVAALIERIAEACSCCKLCGAGGGGYLFIIAKDRDAAVRIREELTQNPPNENARFVSLDLSEEGLVVTRS